jgi:hypothetical protein
MRRGTIFIVLLATAILCSPLVADPPPKEARVKAAFIYNFTQFISWPDDAFADGQAPFVAVVVGDPDPFLGALDDAMNGKNVGGRPIVVRHVATVDQVATCQCVFIHFDLLQQQASGKTLDQFKNQPVLVIVETDEWMQACGVIELFLEDGHMRFKIDPDVVRADRLVVSAKLMQLARIFHRGDKP